MSIIGEGTFTYDRTDTGNSQRFVVQHHDRVRYCVESHQWHVWDGQRWAEDTLGEVFELGKGTVREMWTEVKALADDLDKQKAMTKHVFSSSSKEALHAMINLSKTDPNLRLSVDAFDSALHLLNCRNGTVDLRTGALLPHNRADLITKMCAVDFDPSAECDTWESFVSQCTQHNKEYVDFLRRCVGYSLYGEPREQILLLLHGGGGGGKSTFILTVCNLLGEYAVTADFNTFLKKQKVSTGASEDIAILKGARVVSSIEVDEGKELAEALVKTVTGGDKVRARFLYKGSFEFKPQFALWLVCNHAPVVSAADAAMWRRIRRLPFDNIVPNDRQDPELPAKLATESTGIFAWCVKGCVEWFTHGLNVPQLITDATLTYKRESNVLADFIKDECVLHKHGTVPVSDLRQAYDVWCMATGQKDGASTQVFNKAMGEAGCTQARSKKERLWRGIMMADDPAAQYKAFCRTQDEEATPHTETVYQ